MNTVVLCNYRRRKTKGYAIALTGDSVLLTSEQQLASTVPVARNHPDSQP